MKNQNNDPFGSMLFKMQKLGAEEDRLAKIIALLVTIIFFLFYFGFYYTDKIKAWL